jgi:excisionase family DNA binding protein
VRRRYWKTVADSHTSGSMQQDIQETSLPDMTSNRGQLPFEQRITCTIREACEASGISRSKLYELMAANLLETTTVGRRRLIVVSSLCAILTPHRNTPPR